MAAQRTATSDKFAKVLERSKDVFGSVAHESEDLYHTAQEWVPAHYGTLAALSSAAVGGCLLGYLAGRRSRSKHVRRQQELEVARAHVPDIDIAPFFKFLKLWMLYRVATKG